MDTFGSGTSSQFEKVDFFLFVSYLLFLNLNSNLTLPKLLMSLKLSLIWNNVCWDFHTYALIYEIKTNASCLIFFCLALALAKSPFPAEILEVENIKYGKNLFLSWIFFSEID